MQKFWELYERSLILQGVITTCVLMTWCFLLVTGKEIPVSLGQVVALVLGYYFGSKAQQVAASKSTK